MTNSSETEIPAPTDETATLELFWEIDRLSRSFLKIQTHWAKAQGISGPQLVLLQALKEYDRDEGVSVSFIATNLGVDSSFVTTQTKLMEALGLVSRKSFKQDARVTMISLSEKAHAALAQLRPRQQSLNEILFEGMSDTDMNGLKKHLNVLQKRAVKAALLLEIEAL